jgi:hypothetical protein
LIYALPPDQPLPFIDKRFRPLAMHPAPNCTGILIHSAVDFNLQVPANAALFYVVCTIAASEPLAQAARKRRAVRNTPQKKS